ncbi:hypothetical protein ACFLZV_01405 [Candidatus Margulisiibacteriota bacterium]
MFKIISWDDDLQIKSIEDLFKGKLTEKDIKLIRKRDEYLLSEEIFPHEKKEDFGECKDPKEYYQIRILNLVYYFQYEWDGFQKRLYKIKKHFGKGVCGSYVLHSLATGKLDFDDNLKEIQDFDKIFKSYNKKFDDALSNKYGAKLIHYPKMQFVNGKSYGMRYLITDFQESIGDWDLLVVNNKEYKINGLCFDLCGNSAKKDEYERDVIAGIYYTRINGEMLRFIINQQWPFPFPTFEPEIIEEVFNNVYLLQQAGIANQLKDYEFEFNEYKVICVTKLSSNNV